MTPQCSESTFADLVAGDSTCLKNQMFNATTCTSSAVVTLKAIAGVPNAILPAALSACSPERSSLQVQITSSHNLTVIGGYAFQRCCTADASVTVTGSPTLERIEPHAFDHYIGTIQMANVPKLSYIGEYALYYAGNNESVLDFSSAANLVLGDSEAIMFFEGSVALHPDTTVEGTPCARITRDFVYVEDGHVALTRENFATVDRSTVTCIPDNEFSNNVPGPDAATALGSVVTLSDEQFPQLRYIGRKAFENLRVDFVIETLSNLQTIGPAAFNGGSGTLRVDGVFPKLDASGACYTIYHGSSTEHLCRSHSTHTTTTKTNPTTTAKTTTRPVATTATREPAPPATQAPAGHSHTHLTSTDGGFIAAGIVLLLLCGCMVFVVRHSNEGYLNLSNTSIDSNDQSLGAHLL